MSASFCNCVNQWEQAVGLQVLKDTKYLSLRTRGESNLTLHIQSQHIGIKYACNLCDYHATTKSGLTLHIKSVHEGVKYACNQCDYQAATQSNLTLHIQSQHLGIKYACSQCDYQTTQQSHLKSHKKRKHFWIKWIKLHFVLIKLAIYAKRGKLIQMMDVVKTQSSVYKQ